MHISVVKATVHACTCHLSQSMYVRECITLFCCSEKEITASANVSIIFKLFSINNTENKMKMYPQHEQKGMM